MREIVLDTETTGLDPLRGDRLVEIGCVEIFNRMPTGQSFHRYINPERDMPAEAFAVHGLSAEFLATKPLFHEVVDEFLEFIVDAPLVIHNASFDISFINAELDRIKRGALLDAELLAEVYVDLVGARQSQLLLASESEEIRVNAAGDAPRRQRLVPLAPRVTDAEREAHRAFIATLGDKAIWNEFLPAPAVN